VVCKIRKRREELVRGRRIEEGNFVPHVTKTDVTIVLTFLQDLHTSGYRRSES